MMDHRHHYHDHQDHHRPFGYGGPTSNSGANEVASVMYHKEEEEEDDVAASSVAAAAAGSGGAVVRTLQSFDVSSITTTAFKSPGGAGMAAALGFPFTSAQLKELERQATIYKYMQASVPVPPHLLLPITPNSLDVRFCNNNKDAEPGRCKRTDGKKWRCSRDVVSPQQKYCERHMHKSRTSRSRKPVELHQNRHPTATANKTTRLLHHHTIPPNPISTSISSPHELLRSTIQRPKFDASSYKESNRGLNWTMEGEMLAMDGSKQQQWQQQLLQTNIASVFQQDCIEESLNLIPYPNFGAHQNDECNLFLNPDLETPRGFIDAWSNEDPNTTNESSVSSHGNLSPSSLTLSMATAAAGGDALNDEMGGQIQMGLGVRDSDHYEPQLSSWLSSVSWVGSTAPGGPLAEVLRPSSAAAVSSNPTSPHACNGDSISTPGTKVSSPSAATPEIMPFQWLS